MLTSRPKNLGLAGLEPALNAIAAALRHDHPPELHAWAVVHLADELGLGEVTVVGDPDDAELTAEMMLEVAEAALRSRTRPASCPRPPGCAA